MSMDTYKEKLTKAELYERLSEAEIELNNEGDLLDTKLVFEKIKNRYGEK